MVRMAIEQEATFDPEKKIEDIEGLWWIKGDVGSWEGPFGDWRDTHRDRIVLRPKQRRVVVQAGGNLGMYPNLLAKYYDVVYTFEPDPSNFACLCMNTKLANVVKFNAAVGSKNQLISLTLSNYANRGMTQIEHGADGAYIPTLMIDQLALPVCDLIWLDIEQYEQYGIEGAVETIKRCLPVIALETRNDPTVKLLDSLGYSQVDQSTADGVFVHSSQIE